MIEALSNWVKEIIYVVMFASFMELLLPASNMQKFIRVIMGLLIMLAILNPIIDFLQNKTLQNDLPVLRSVVNKSLEGNSINENAVQEQNILARKIFEKDLAKQISATIKGIDGVKDAYVTVSLKQQQGKPFSGEVGSINIFVRQSIKDAEISKVVIGPNPPYVVQNVDPALENKIKKTVSEIYQIRTTCICVKKID